MNKVMIGVAKAVVMSAMQDERVQAQVKQAAVAAGDAIRAWAAEVPKLRAAR